MIRKWSYAFLDWKQLYSQILGCAVVFIFCIYVLCNSVVTGIINMLQPYEGQLTDNTLILFLIVSQPECKFLISIIVVALILYYLT